jgi:hypothetical membrane protein
MGGELLVIATAALGLLAFLLLAWRSRNRAARTYALPTLVGASLVGAYTAWEKPLANLPWYFFVGFCSELVYSAPTLKL